MLLFFGSSANEEVPQERQECLGTVFKFVSSPSITSWRAAALSPFGHHQLTMSPSRLVRSCPTGMSCSMLPFQYIQERSHFQCALSCLSEKGYEKELQVCYKDWWNFIQFLGDAVVKNPPASAGDVGDMGSIPWLGRAPRGGNGKPLQCSCLENPMDKGARRTIVHAGHKRVEHN